MNVLRHYITNITFLKPLEIIENNDCFYIFELIADVNCYGNISYQKHFYLSESQYNSVIENGYYIS